MKSFPSNFLTKSSGVHLIFAPGWAWVQTTVLFFKTFRDELKANALVSHLECALHRFPRNQRLGLNHLADAVKALAAIKASEDCEKTFSFVGWQYVVHLATEFGTHLAMSEHQSACKDLEFIVEQAIRWRDEAYARSQRTAD